MEDLNPDELQKVNELKAIIGGDRDWGDLSEEEIITEALAMKTPEEELSVAATPVQNDEPGQAGTPAQQEVTPVIDETPEDKPKILGKYNDYKELEKGYSNLLTKHQETAERLNRMEPAIKALENDPGVREVISDYYHNQTVGANAGIEPVANSSPVKPVWNPPEDFDQDDAFNPNTSSGRAWIEYNEAVSRYQNDMNAMAERERNDKERKQRDAEIAYMNEKTALGITDEVEEELIEFYNTSGYAPQPTLKASLEFMLFKKEKLKPKEEPKPKEVIKPVGNPMPKPPGSIGAVGVGSEKVVVNKEEEDAIAAFGGF
jgi:hypothetical protein